MARTQSRPARQRNAAATRAAILQSARRAFAKAGYDGAGVREIAGGAGVTAMLVNRYFGSKERLFAEAVAESIATTSVLGPQITKSGASGRQIAAVLIGITKAEDTPLEGFQIMLRSASSARAARIARKLIEQHHQKLIAAALEGSLAAQRAGVMLALIAGFQLMRQVLELPALAKADPGALVKVLGPVFDRLLAATR
ncbi:MAG TPA: TetR family transcriptional regulator [Steroidobacteraceae bacterium]|jgi:AcrR family transcriptional regulator|nr:TetR family transcriptional regulator [Steroidobacteraceae bacterium]